MAKRKRTTRRNPILNVKEYVEQHNEHHEYLDGYLSGGWGRKQPDTSSLRAEMMARAAKSLFANNHHVRLSFMWAVQHAFGTNMPKPSDGFFHLTLAPDIFAMPLSRALLFDIDELRKWAHAILEGVNYFGMIDIALYPYLGLSPIVSWHVHVLVWGKGKAEFERMKEALNLRYRTLVPGRTAAHIVRVRKVLGRLCYIMKAPLSEYRVSRPKEIMDRQTGELRLVAKQWKEPACGINALRNLRLLEGRKLPTMMVVGGEGTRLLRRVWPRMKTELNAERKHRRRKQERAYYGKQRPRLSPT